jgi:hypothetical protein
MLKYIDKEDLDSNKVKMIPIDERESDPSSSDADDLVALKKSPGAIKRKNEPQKIVSSSI